jgi:hypothetical protein
MRKRFTATFEDAAHNLNDPIELSSFTELLRKLGYSTEGEHQTQIGKLWEIVEVYNQAYLDDIRYLLLQLESLVSDGEEIAR